MMVGHWPQPREHGRCVAAQIGENRMLAMLTFDDLFWIAVIVTGAVWYFSTETQTQQIEAKLDRILKHLGLDDDEPTQP